MEFSLKTRVVFGPDSLSALESLAEQPVFLVTDRFLNESGLVRRVTGHLRGPVTVFDAVTPDPSLGTVAQGVRAFQESGSRVVVAVGGGSPMDCAKAIRHFGGAGCPLWCVPTTAGTGSEMTAFAILTDTEAGVKHALVDEALLPDVALLDPGFLEGIPPKVTADTGMDVLSHAVEAYVARGASAFTDAWAEKAFALACGALTPAYQGDGGAKARMLEASCLAGMAFNAAGLGACHALAHAIGGAYHLPHGAINARLLPAVVDWHAAHLPETSQKYARLAAVAGWTPTARGLSSSLRRLARQLGQSGGVSVQIDPKRVIPVALQDRCAPFDPAKLDEAGLEEVLARVVW